MEDVDLSAERFEKYREAGDILRETLDAAAEKVEPGASHLDVAEFAEAQIEAAGAEPAFPANISIDEEASHASPGRDDESEFHEGELVCLDVGVHVDGWIADAAISVDLGDHTDLIEAAEEALDAAIEVAGPGVHTGEIGAEIQDVIEAYGYNPVVNLSGHGLAEYDAHTNPTIPNRGVDTGVELEVGDVIAIEPFATDGGGTVSEGQKTEIYSLRQERSVRNRRARELLGEIVERYDRLPFAARWFEGARTDMTLNRLTQQNVLESYPVLKGPDGTKISQAEHTMIVTEDGVELTTD
ncbi:MAG: type II methionyl aminopeptidase [Halobacteriota archaeon]|uniref:type II methionyl aminopeptidase n=1 Tax=Halodesulfurarchaeum sp. HSR-GB TaxID=3074077 RepID=UPI00286587A1|nr:type II methionyl aminopeptidase [Halodesulfurarchaeum sp. HSR-GB]MDR5656358.1 type II methionyl aminopeptidase [Halodesulfurarchaeum sp. HSR-GB]